MRLDFPYVSENYFRKCHPPLHAFRFALCFLLCLVLSPIPSWAATNWSKEVLHFAFIDQTINGDSANTYKVKPNNPSGYHGGNIKSLQRLDELVDPVVTAPRINPAQNQTSQSLYPQAPGKLTTPELKNDGFHGYLIDDFTAMNMHFRSLDGLKKLVGETPKMEHQSIA